MIREEDIRDIKRESKINEMKRRDIKQLIQRAKFVVVNCPGCGSARYKFMFGKGGFKFVKCHDCRMLFVNPRPTDEDLRWYYTEAESPREFAEMVKTREGKRKELIYVQRAKDIVSIIGRYLPDVKDISLVEVGAGTGGFLEVLRGMKPEWRYMTIEPEKASVRFLKEKGFEVIDDIVKNVDKSRLPRIDVVLSFELIEHIFDPHKFMEKVYHTLQSQGLFILTTPNYYGFDFLAIGEGYKNIVPPNHLNYFNPDTIKTLLQKTKFDALNITTPGMLDVDLARNFYSKSKNTGNKFLDFLLYETSDDILHKFQNFLQDNRLSGHMMVIARKP